MPLSVDNIFSLCFGFGELMNFLGLLHEYVPLVFIPVVVVVILVIFVIVSAVAMGDLGLIDDAPQKTAFDIDQAISEDPQCVSMCLSKSGYENHAIYLVAQHQNIGKSSKWGAVHYDAIKVLVQALNKKAHPFGRK